MNKLAQDSFQSSSSSSSSVADLVLAEDYDLYILGTYGSKVKVLYFEDFEKN